MPKLTGTLLWYWAICPREAWLMAHEINPDEDDPYLELGRFLSQQAYPRSKRRELSLPGMKLDLIETDGGEVVVAEVKKSSRFVEAARLQLLFYLERLEEHGVSARGELRIPKERKRLPVELDDAGRTRLHRAIGDLQRLIKELLPPPPQRIPFCRRCAYREFCWGDFDPEPGAGRELEELEE
jgi:CRISPR-associated exonuclease Cas4